MERKKQRAHLEGPFMDTGASIGLDEFQQLLAGISTTSRRCSRFGILKWELDP